MKKIKKINFKILSLKTLSYRILRIFTNIILFGLLLQDWSKAISYNIYLTIIATSQYFLFDYFFNKNTDLSIETKGCVIWLTGLSGSGKTTIANKLQKQLLEKGKNVQQLDGDILRKTVCKDLGFSLKDRKTNLERAGEIAKLLSQNNVIVICSFISPIKSIRNSLNNNINNFIEIFVDCPIEICEERDVKGLYKKARQGIIKNFTGISQKYEKPINPKIVCKTHMESLNESVNKIITYLNKNKNI